MLKRFASLFLSSLLCVTVFGTRVISQVIPSFNQQFTPVAIKFNPKSDAHSYRPPGLTQSDQPTDRAIVGEDNRFPVTKREFPWTAIGRIDWNIKDKVISQCTGTLIARNLILTNSHCLVKSERNPEPIIPRSSEQKGNIRITFKPNLVEGTFDDSATVIDYAYGWEAGVKYSEDWAILKLDKNLGDDYGYLGWRSLDFSNPAIIKALRSQARLAGYSGDYPTRKQRKVSRLEGKEMDTAGVHSGCTIEGSSEGLNVAFLSDGSARYNDNSEKAEKGLILHNCDTTGGSSGSAIVAKFDDGQYYILGIHAGWNPFDESTIPVGASRETCKIAKRDQEGNVLYDRKDDLEYNAVGICRNRAVQSSQWAKQATKMRLGNTANLHGDTNQVDPLRIKESNGTTVILPASNQIDPSRITEGNGTTVILPASYDKQKSYPAVVLLPFTGGTGLRLFDWAFAKPYSDRQTNPFIVVIPSGTGKSSDYDTGEAFSATIQRYEKQVKSDLKTLIPKYNIDAKRVSIGGYSLGADLGWALSLRNPDLFRGAILIDSICGYRLDSSMNQLAERDFRAFMIIGKKEAGESNHPMNGIRILLNQYQVPNLYKEFPKSEHETILNDISPEMFMQSVDYSLAI
jgi:pimeloyl-ACP methyl ester carboxylesterase